MKQNKLNVNFKAKLHKYITYLILTISLVFQFFVWSNWTSKIKATFTITPLPPSRIEMNIFSLGDKSLLYRIYGLQLQNAGDTFGETTPLKEYDYEKLEKWFYALTELDDKSEYIPSIAGFYFSASQNALDNKYIVDYLINFADKDPEKHWRWYVTSAYILKHKLKDKERAFYVARKILNLNSNIPFINRIMSLFMLNEKDLNTCKGVNMIVDLIKSGDLENVLLDKYFSTKDGNYNVMFKLVKHRIDMVLKNKELIKKCLNKQ